MAAAEETVLDGTVGGALDPDNQKPGEDETGGTPVAPSPVEVNALVKRAEGFMDQIDDLKAKRDAINKEISAVYDEVEGASMARDAFKAAHKFRGLTEDKRESYDLTYMICRRAAQAPIQFQLLESDE